MELVAMSDDQTNSCVLKNIFLEEVEQPKISPKSPGNTFSDALLMSRFENLEDDTAKKKPRFTQF